MWYIFVKHIMTSYTRTLYAFLLRGKAMQNSHEIPSGGHSSSSILQIFLIITSQPTIYWQIEWTGIPMHLIVIQYNQYNIHDL